MRDDLIRRREAIDAICDNCDTVEASCPHYPCSRYVAVEKLPSAEHDYKFDEWCTECKEYDRERHCCPRFNHVIRTTLQEVQKDRKKGKWIKATGMMPPEFHGHHCCSECGNFANMEPPFGNREDLSKFCPNCGADMRERKEE